MSPSGFACFSISIVPGITRLRTTHLAYSPGLITTDVEGEPARIVVRRLRAWVTRSQVASTNS